ncbi:MAG: hypothetical protein WCG27_11410 [Pseudomonadota bacterium]
MTNGEHDNNSPVVITPEMIGDYQLDPIKCVKYSWEILKSNFWQLVGAGAIMMIIQGAISNAGHVGMIAGTLVGGVFMGGMYGIYLKELRGGKAKVEDLFEGFKIALIPLMLAGLVSGLLTAIGIFLLIIPGIYLAVSWVFTFLIIIDKKMDFWPAMELSRKVVGKNFWPFLGLMAINFAIMIAGLLCLGVGIFVAFPLMVGSVSYAYEEIFNKK